MKITDPFFCDVITESGFIDATSMKYTNVTYEI